MLEISKVGLTGKATRCTITSQWNDKWPPYSLSSWCGSDRCILIIPFLFPLQYFNLFDFFSRSLSLSHALLPCLTPSLSLFRSLHLSCSPCLTLSLCTLRPLSPPCALRLALCLSLLCLCLSLSLSVSRSLSHALSFSALSVSRHPSLAVSLSDTGPPVVLRCLSVSRACLHHSLSCLFALSLVVCPLLLSPSCSPPLSDPLSLSALSLTPSLLLSLVHLFPHWLARSCMCIPALVLSPVLSPQHTHTLPHPLPHVHGLPLFCSALSPLLY